MIERGVFAKVSTRSSKNLKMRVNVVQFCEYFSVWEHVSYTSMKSRQDRCKLALIFAKCIRYY